MTSLIGFESRSSVQVPLPVLPLISIRMPPLCPSCLASRTPPSAAPPLLQAELTTIIASVVKSAERMINARCTLFFVGRYRSAGSEFT